MLAACAAGLRTTGKPMRRAASVASCSVRTLTEAAEGTPWRANRLRLVCLLRQPWRASGAVVGRPSLRASRATVMRYHSVHVITPASACRSASACPAAVSAA
ncbi:hypothetical protein QFZ63_001975 [Streptomyces sp. B3I7]|nr:hypothetical protein [Streptomyces sp. B3I7]